MRVCAERPNRWKLLPGRNPEVIVGGVDAAERRHDIVLRFKRRLNEPEAVSICNPNFVLNLRLANDR